MSLFPNITFLWVLLHLTFVSANPKCTCDYLISVALFQNGVCGRTARCQWELMYLRKNLLGVDTTEESEMQIKSTLCKIPTYKQYVMDYKSPKGTYMPCGSDARETDQDKLIEEFEHYPMPALYTISEADGKNYYVKAMSDCQKAEVACTQALFTEITKMCRKDVTLDHIKEIETKYMKARVRGKMAYQFVWGKNSKAMEKLTYDNKCSLQRISRIRHGAIDQKDDVSYKDGYDVAKLLKPNKCQQVGQQIRPPLYDLYVLYLADPKKKFSGTPPEKRWNERMVYHELALYLPTKMIEHYHKAVECVYKKVNSKFMPWQPEKFCGDISTFICVDKSKLKNPDCGMLTDKDTASKEPAQLMVDLPPPFSYPKGPRDKSNKCYSY